MGRWLRLSAHRNLDFTDVQQVPAGVYQHSDGRHLLGRKLKGKSVREMKDLGLTVSKPGGIERVASR